MRLITRPHHPDKCHLQCSNPQFKRAQAWERITFLEAAIKELEGMADRTGWLSESAQAQLDLYRCRMNQLVREVR